MSVFFDAPARLVYTSSRKSQTQEAIGTTGHLTAEKGRRTLFFYRESESNERVMLTTSPVKKIVHFRNLDGVFCGVCLCVCRWYRRYG